MLGSKRSDFTENFKDWNVVESTDDILVLTCVGNNCTAEVSQIIDFLYSEIPSVNWSINVENNKIVAKKAKKAKYNRMYTSGCFDIFHYGHLNILLKSKELCNYLIVGVSTDELIEKEKGKRPIIPFNERVKVVQAIGVVDEVIPQEDKNKQKIVDKYHIDAISVGDDWRGRYPEVTCAMEYFPYTKNVSSTILKDTLQLNPQKL